MPITTLRASGNNQYDQMTDAERASFGSAQSAQDFVLRKRLQDEAIARQEADRVRGETSAERINAANLASQREIGGTFTERERLADERNARLIAPQMEALKQAAEERRLAREEDAPMRELTKRLIGDLTGQLGGASMQYGVTAGGQPSVGVLGGASMGAPATGGGMDMKKLRQVGRSIGLNIPESEDEQIARSIKNAHITSLMAKVERGGRGAQEASDELQKSFNVSMPVSAYADTSRPVPQAINREYIQQSALKEAQDFTTKAMNTLGFNPTDDDIETLVKSRDELVNSITAENPDISIEDARTGANRMMDDILKQGKSGMGWGPGWIKKARQRLGTVDKPFVAADMFGTQEAPSPIKTPSLGITDFVSPIPGLIGGASRMLGR